MFLCDRNKKIVGPCQKLFDSLDNDPPFRPRSRRHNYPLVSGHHHPEHSFSESTCSGSPQTVILRYDMIGDQRLLSYAATDHRRHRSRSAAPGSGNRNKLHHHRSLSRSRPRSSSPRHRYQQLHQHQATTAPRIFLPPHSGWIAVLIASLFCTANLQLRLNAPNNFWCQKLCVWRGQSYCIIEHWALSQGSQQCIEMSGLSFCWIWNNNNRDKTLQ